MTGLPTLPELYRQALTLKAQGKTELSFGILTPHKYLGNPNLVVKGLKWRYIRPKPEGTKYYGYLVIQIREVERAYKRSCFEVIKGGKDG